MSRVFPCRISSFSCCKKDPLSKDLWGNRRRSNDAWAELHKVEEWSTVFLTIEFQVPLPPIVCFPASKRLHMSMLVVGFDLLKTLIYCQFSYLLCLSHFTLDAGNDFDRVLETLHIWCLLCLVVIAALLECLHVWLLLLASQLFGTVKWTVGP